MAKFIYKMQNILNIKYKMEEQEKIRYANANHRLQQETLKLQQIFDDIHVYEQSVRDNSQDMLDLMELRRLQEAIMIKKEQARQQALAVEAARMTVEAARKRLHEVMIDRKTHEKLRENAFEEFKVELNEQEKKEVDELVSFRFGKK